jgi:hypothetical protein
MGDIVNLNRARKAGDKARAKTAAARNRVTFGLSKTQKTAAALERSASAETLDGAKLEPE